MNKRDKFIIKYIIFATPFSIFLMTWAGFSDPDQLSMAKGFSGFVWDFLGWVFMFWTALSFYMTTKMVVFASFRDIILKKVAKIQERDEREAHIAGEAAKFSFISTMAVLFLFLFLSVFTLTIGKYPKEQRGPGHNGYVSIGLNFHPLAQDNPVIKKRANGIEIFTYAGVPLSSSMLIILILLWQFASYKYMVRKALT